MKCIIGLGNIGKQYEKTRHNVGFLVVDLFKEQEVFSNFALQEKFFAQLSEGMIGGEKVLLVKPTTLMNLSGKALLALQNFYKFDLKDVLVVYDDKDMDFGKLRYREEGRSGGHNGVSEIIRVLGQNFPRLKVGVGDIAHPAFSNASDFVLGKFSPKEWEALQENILMDACDRVREWIEKNDQ